MDTLMTALTRLAPPPPLPAESGSGSGTESESGSGSGYGAQPGVGTGGWGGASATGGGSGRGSGSGWLGQRALVAGCGNSALGYQMWQQVRAWGRGRRACVMNSPGTRGESSSSPIRVTDYNHAGMIACIVMHAAAL